MHCASQGRRRCGEDWPERGGGRLIIDQERPLRPTIERFPQEGEIPRKLSLLINCLILEVLAKYPDHPDVLGKFLQGGLGLGLAILCAFHLNKLGQ